MADALQTAKTASQKIMEVDAALEEIFRRNFGMDEEHNKDNMGYQAYATLAVQVAIAFANVFMAIRHPQDHRTYRAVCDLTFGLNSNKFWENNAPFLMPSVHSALNAYRDCADMLSVRTNYGVDDALISSARAQPLELFVLIAYCVGGPPLMTAASLQLKRDLSPYLVG